MFGFSVLIILNKEKGISVMKKLFIFLFALVLSFSIMGTAKADLTGFYIGTDHFVYDSDLGITWYDYTYDVNEMLGAVYWVSRLAVGGTTASSDSHV